ncbi:hypothetical protein RVIR1_06860 [Candidatus Rickettsiella viridis]|uniref:Uncharacterized protein n=1 Tax=Candidatus Rickettsiella viridis TaxID=676208 RepID=A0A2Z5UW20_9COXI|nr:hypothetical protein [Candidatus Rickettsiella viridis]BBB15183.1 hypothetical protein RVIR1_06860 [Candidatus Rickettsiella viridis]
MDLRYFDRLIPPRWALLFRYYLPFFKKPPPLYFKLREFINKKKYEPNTPFNLNTLYDLFVILDNYSQLDPDNTLNALIDKIIDSTIFYQQNLISDLSLEAFINRFDSKISDALLDKFLNRLPESIFHDYITGLSKSFLGSKKEKSYYEKHIKYCEKLNHRFNSNAKLIFFVSIPYDFIVDKLKDIEQIISLESIFAMQFLKILYSDLKNNFLNFIVKWKKNLNDNPDNNLDSILLKNENDAISSLNENLFHFFNSEKTTLFKDSLIQTNHHNESLIGDIFNFLTEQQAFEFINKLIIKHFSPLDKKELDISTFILIEKNLEKYPLNLFQTLAIFYVIKKTINLNALAKKYTDFCLKDTDLEIFSTQIQVTVIENSLKSIQTYISKTIIGKIEHAPEKLNLHILWREFLTGDSIYGDQIQLLEKILEKIPEEFKIKEKTSLDFFKQLYSYLETPSLKKFRQVVKEEQRKQQSDEMIKEEEKESFRKGIRNGSISHVSRQRMEELFGEKEAESMMEQLQKKGIGFFDGNDKRVTDTVIAEMKETKEFYSDAFQLP